MLLVEKTTGGNTGQIRIEKSIGALFIQTNVPMLALKNTTIDVYIQRNEGQDFRIATSVPLDVFIALGVSGDSSVYSYDTFQTCATVELCELGAIELADKDAIILSIENLPPNSHTRINGLERPVMYPLAIKLEKKTVQSSTTVDRISTVNFDLMAISGISHLKEVTLRYDNGATNRHLPSELVAISKDVDPIVLVDSDGSTQTHHNDIVVIPVDSVEEIDVIKTSGGKIDFYLKQFNDEDLEDEDFVDEDESFVE